MLRGALWESPRSRSSIRANYEQEAKPCLNCGDPIMPQPGQKLVQVRKKRFCSRSCSTAYNNRIAPKRAARQRVCECGETFTGKRTLCPACGDARLNRANRMLKREASHRTIRGHAKHRVSSRLQVCENCGYSHHVECCHRKPVAGFHDTAQLSEINADSNLILLCPNCHWELDHGMLPHLREQRFGGGRI